MQNKINHTIQQQLEGFTVQPSASVWDEVEKALEPTKDKKRFFYWWLTGFVLLFIGGFIGFKMYHQQQQLVLENNKKSKPIAIQSYKTKTTKNQPLSNNIKQPVQASSSGNNKEVQTNINIDSNDADAIKIDAEEKQNIQKNNKAPFEQKQEVASILYAKNEIKNSVLANNKTINNHQEIVSNNQVDISAESIVESDVFIFPHQFETASTQVPLIQLPILNAPQSVLPFITLSGKSPSIINNKHKYSYFFGIGTTFTKSTINTTANPSNLNSGGSSLITGGAGGGAGIVSNKMQPPTTGFNIALGIATEKKISKKLVWSNAFVYQLLNNFQPANLDTAILIDRSVYISGSNKSIANTLHTVGIESSLLYQLNNTQKKPLQLVMGAQVQATIASKWLYSNYLQQLYYYDAANANTIFVNGLLGLRYKAFKQASIQLQWQPYFTPIHKTANNNLLQLFQLRLIQSIQ